MKHIDIFRAVWVRPDKDACLTNLPEWEPIPNIVSIILCDLAIDDPPFALGVTKAGVSLWLLYLEPSYPNLLFDFQSSLVVATIGVFDCLRESLEFIIGVFNLDVGLKRSHTLSVLRGHPWLLLASLHSDWLVVAAKLFQRPADVDLVVLVSWVNSDLYLKSLPFVMDLNWVDWGAWFLEQP